MVYSKYDQNSWHDRFKIGIESCETHYGSLMKLILLNLKIIFGKNHEQTMKHL
jgi:hypothetical protein